LGAVEKGKLFWFFSAGYCVGKNQMCQTVRLAFFFCFYAAKIPLSFCRLARLTMNANEITAASTLLI